MTSKDKTPNPPTVEWLRSLLAETGTTQTEAAQLLNVDAVTVRRWATGRRAMDWRGAELLRRRLRARKIDA